MVLKRAAALTVLTLAVLALLLALPAGRTAAAPAPTAQPPETSGVNAFPANINPLTGLPVADPALLDRKPVLIKVSNYPANGRPHAGLSAADMVFEYYIGEYANRFIALFYGQDASVVGPVRSGRLIDGQLANLYHGILAYGNADPQVDDYLIRELGDRAIAFDDVNCPVMCGLRPHDVAGVFADSAALTRFAAGAGISQARPNLDGMAFSTRLPQGGLPAQSLMVRYARFNKGEWRYDPASGKYLRWIESWADVNEYPLIPLVDRNTGGQLGFSNVILVFARYIEYAPTLHDVQLWTNLGAQRAVLFRDGVMQEGTWHSPGYDRPLQFFDPSGLPLALKPGNTWVVVVGLSSKFNQLEGNGWELRYDLP